MTDVFNHPNRRSDRRGNKRGLLIIAGIVVAVVLIGIATRIQAEKTLERRVAEKAAVIVATQKPSVRASGEAITLPGDVQAYAEAPIYARTSGYLKAWKVDLGARVKKGQLLAEIDAPEVDQQLLQTQADVATATANVTLARSTAQRWIEMRQSDAVSQQETDEKIGDAAAKEAVLESARANVERLREMQGFKRIVAPFDGVVTARNIDVGALVSAASGVELFRIAASEKLRVYVQVPQIYSAVVQPGLNAELEFIDKPGQRFAGKLVRSAQSIDNDSRTLRVEIEVENSKAQLLPGAYARVHLNLPVQPALRIPVSTLIFRSDGLQVATVDAEQRVHLKKIQLGRDFGTEVEVVAGIDSADDVIVNPPDAIADNQSVRVAAPKADDKAVKN